MKNYKVNYAFDGYRWFDFVQAESEEKAKEYFEWIFTDRNVISVLEDNSDIPALYCPLGWVAPESREQAKARGYFIWEKAYLRKFIVNDMPEYSDELDAFLLSEGWNKKIEYIGTFEDFVSSPKDDDYSHTEITYRRREMKIDFDVIQF